ncbi:MAG TPA: class I SAM-dependent methyltransferase [Anaerolineae bacterium]|nr:class I SAM-dependent methyltransferase [Anaerolineae bacterium]
MAVYATAAVVGQATATTEFLADLSGPVNVLDIGAGTGSFSRALQRACDHPKNRFYWIDINAERMEASRNALWFAGAIETIVADLRQEIDFPDIPGREIDVVLAGLLRPYLPPGAYARTLSALITEKLKSSGLAVLVEMAASSFSNSQVRRELSDQEVLSDMSRALSATGMLDVGAPIRLEVPIRVEETGARYEGVLLLDCKRRQAG